MFWSSKACQIQSLVGLLILTALTSGTGLTQVSGITPGAPANEGLRDGPPSSRTGASPLGGPPNVGGSL